MTCAVKTPESAPAGGRLILSLPRSLPAIPTLQRGGFSGAAGKSVYFAAIASISQSTPFGSSRTATQAARGLRHEILRVYRIKAAKSAISRRKHVVLKTFSSFVPAASSSAATFLQLCSACAAIPSGTAPVFGSTGICPRGIHNAAHDVSLRIRPDCSRGLLRMNDFHAISSLQNVPYHLRRSSCGAIYRICRPARILAPFWQLRPQSVLILSRKPEKHKPVFHRYPAHLQPVLMEQIPFFLRL